MAETLREQIEKIRESFECSSSAEGALIADHLDSLIESDLEEGEEKECIVDSLREVIDWAECAISRLTHQDEPSAMDLLNGKGGCTG